MIPEFVIAILLGILGLILGSFCGASVWRLRSKQLAQGERDKTASKVLKNLAKGAFGTKDHSVCLECGRRLAWYDLIPVFSWLSTGGKCRYCHRKIGYFEPLIELSLAAYFVVSYLFWPGGLTDGWQIASLALWLVAGVTLAISFAYDAKWFLLPDGINYITVVIGLAVAVGTIVTASDHWSATASVLAGILILSGLYLVLYLVSRGRWVGFGDVKLGLALALLLSDWRLSLLALFLANLIGTIIVLPGLMTRKLKGDSHIPFGPLFIAGAIIAKIWGLAIVAWLSQYLF